MNLIATEPKKALNKAYRKQKTPRSEYDSFIYYLEELRNKIVVEETEEHNKNYIRDFLVNTFYKKYKVNTKGRTDLAISTEDKTAVIVETKRPGNNPDMITRNNINKKAMHEVILYYLEERILSGNDEIKNVIITNGYEWFIFDAVLFEKLFYRNGRLVKDFNSWKAKQKTAGDTPHFYNEIAKPFLDKVQEDIPFVYFNIEDYKGVPEQKNLDLLKLLSPPHLLKVPFANDSNTLDRRFYQELLHIIGLEETKEGSKKVIKRKEKSRRNSGSLLENTIRMLDTLDIIESGKGEETSKEEELFNTSLELVITWMNRILFLKLLEAQIVNYHRGDKEYKFLDVSVIEQYDDLYELFHEVLAVIKENRKEDIIEKFKDVPYLNSSLFEISPLEKRTFRISGLKDRYKMPVHKQSVLRKSNGKPPEEMHTLEYLLRFLDAFDFSSESAGAIQEENKSLINASVLGLIFEKINGYREGSYFTPGFITMYMSRETIRRAVLRKFGEVKGWKCSSLDELRDKIDGGKEARREANEIVNSLKICDPAVGSGHFLVSALNEMISVKSELGILSYTNGERIKNYRVEIENDELVITDAETEDPFEYFMGAKGSPIKELQDVQEALFHEKETLIENSLFGVDINHNSVKICRLRLWIELLKNSYYTEDTGYTELETLPNIDINIKPGNSLISRYPLDADIKKALGKSGYSVENYRNAVREYRQASDKTVKKEMEKLIDTIKEKFESSIYTTDPRIKKLSSLRDNLFQHMGQGDMFGLTKKQKDEWQKKTDKLNGQIKKLEEEIEEIRSSKIYKNAFEWRFEFPEVLNDKGDYVGFDVVIGNPPYIPLSKTGNIYSDRNYKTYTKTGDIYCLFYERGTHLLKSNGYLTYITSNSWLRSTYGVPLKKYFGENIRPVLLINIEDIQIFGEATVESNIIILQKGNKKKSFLACSLTGEFKKELNIKKFVDTTGFKYDFPETEDWFIGDAVSTKLKNKIETGTKLLKDFNVQIDYGIKTGLNEAFIIDEKKKNELINADPKNSEIIKPILRGRDLRKYAYDFCNNYLINSHNGIKSRNIDRIKVEKDYPAIFDYLSDYLPTIKDRGDKGEHWSNLRNCAYLEKFDKPKIVWGEISDRPKFAYDGNSYYAEATTFLMTGERLKYLLAILNSHVAEWYFKLIGTTTGMGTNRWKKYKIELMPVKVPDEKTEEKIIEFVDKIINIKNENPDADTTLFESEIDKLVYELYGLTGEEIELVEKSIS